MSNPSTTVKVPAAAAGYSPAMQDADLRSQINAVLLRDGHVTKIQDQLLHSLNAHASNWPTQVQNHALALLRSGEVTTFPALLRRVMDDVRQDTSAGSGGSSSKSKPNGADADGAKKVNGAGTDPAPNLAVPAAVVEEALKVTRECLEAVCEMDENGST